MENAVKYLVDDNGEITIRFFVEDQQSGLEVKVSDPKWSPGTIVVIDEETMGEIRNGLISYAFTGLAPEIGSERPRQQSSLRNLLNS